MPTIKINKKQIPVSRFDALINSLLLLWRFGDIRKTPRNSYTFSMLGICITMLLVVLPIAWLIIHVPFLWPEALACMVGILCVAIGMAPHEDYSRALLALLTACSLLHFNITFDATVFGFHIEPILYKAVIIFSAITLWRRFFNYLCWKQIDRILMKYQRGYQLR